MSRQRIRGPDRLRGGVIRQIYKLNIDTRLQRTYSQTCYEAKEITTNLSPLELHMLFYVTKIHILLSEKTKSSGQIMTIHLIIW